MTSRSWRVRWWHYVLFLMFLAALSRVLTSKESPSLVSQSAMFLGNLFKGTING